MTVGRPLMEPLKQRPTGVRDVIENMTKQLQAMMYIIYRTASKDLKHIAPSVIWER